MLLIGLVVSIQQTFLRPKHVKDFGLVPGGLTGEYEMLVLEEEPVTELEVRRIQFEYAKWPLDTRGCLERLTV